MIRRVLCPELNGGMRVTIWTTGGIPITTANQSRPNTATAARSAFRRRIRAAAASISGSAPTYIARSSRIGLIGVCVGLPQ
jgi:hypothetical protein